MIAFLELLAVMGGWWFVFATLYHVITSRVEAYYQVDHDSVVIDDIYTGLSLIGILSFLALVPGILA
jgi:hypothetical protein